MAVTTDGNPIEITTIPQLTEKTAIARDDAIIIGDAGTANIKRVSFSTILNAVYPVGSIYMSANAANPSELIGGTWVAWGAGRVAVGVDANNTSFNAAEKTGGEAAHALSAAELPSHSHTFIGKAVNTGGNSSNPTATFKGTSAKTNGADTNHTHTFAGAATSTAGAHTHTYSGTTSTNGNHNHTTPGEANNLSGGGNWVAEVYRYASTINNRLTTSDAGNHNHSFSGTSSSNGNHYHTVSGTTGTISANHSHDFTAVGSVALSGSHTHSVTASGTIGAAGSGGAHNNMQPYITCYMWKRTA